MKYVQEKVLPGPNHSFKTHDEVGSVIECLFHIHPEYELTYIASSFGTRFIGDNISNFDAGNLALIGPMVPHHYYNSPNDSESDTWGHARVIQFVDNFAGNALFALPEMTMIRKMLDDSKYGIDFPADTANRIHPLIDRLFSAEGHHRLVLLLEILGILAESTYNKLSNIAGDAAEIPVQPDNRIARILRYIHHTLEAGQDVTLEMVAAKANMNYQAFSRYFRKTTLKCFIDYVNEIKIGKACRLLIHSDKTAAEICFEAGFNNLSNFNRHFQKIKGMTPKKFRESFNRHRH